MVDVQKLTVTGQLLGSPAYMSPELVQGKPVDFRADVFSLGTLLYEMVTSELPFKGNNTHEVLKRIADGKFIPAEVVNPVVGSHLGRIVSKALAPNPEDRYATVTDLRKALEQFIAIVGLTNPEKELKKYFGNPLEYSTWLQKHIVSDLLDAGKRALANNEKAAALSLFDRLLCVDPGNQRTLEILSAIASQRRWIRTGVVLIALFALGGVAYAAWLYVPALRYPDPSGGAISDSSNLAGFENPDASTASVRPPATMTTDAAVADLSPPKPFHRRRRPSRVRKGQRSATRRRVAIVPRPKNVQIWLNGKLLGRYGPDLRSISLPAGPVTLKFSNPACCFDYVKTFARNKIPTLISPQLKWKNARVRLHVAPNTANIRVGRQVARSGQAVSVTIPNWSTNGQSTARVTATATGFDSQSKNVTIRANQTTELKWTLKKSSTP